MDDLTREGDTKANQKQSQKPNNMQKSAADPENSRNPPKTSQSPAILPGVLQTPPKAHPIRQKAFGIEASSPHDAGTNGQAHTKPSLLMNRPYPQQDMFNGDQDFVNFMRHCYSVYQRTNPAITQKGPASGYLDGEYQPRDSIPPYGHPPFPIPPFPHAQMVQRGMPSMPNIPTGTPAHGQHSQVAQKAQQLPRHHRPSDQHIHSMISSGHPDQQHQDQVVLAEKRKRKPRIESGNVEGDEAKATRTEDLGLQKDTPLVVGSSTFRHRATGNHATSSPAPQQIAIASHVLSSTPERQVARPTPSNVPTYPVRVLHFNNREEAIAGVKPPEWLPPKQDNTVPTTAEQRREWVRKLVDAFLDISNCADRKGPVFKRRWYDPAIVPHVYKDFYDRKEIEKVCWDIEDAVESLHRDGPKVFNCYDPAFRKLVAKTDNLSFSERMNYLIQLFSKYKARCDKMFKSSVLETYVADPAGMMITANANRGANDNRQKYIQTGRSLKKQKPASRDSSTEAQVTHHRASPINAVPSTAGQGGSAAIESYQHHQHSSVNRNCNDERPDTAQEYGNQLNGIGDELDEEDSDESGDDGEYEHEEDEGGSAEFVAVLGPATSARNGQIHQTYSDSEDEEEPVSKRHKESTLSPPPPNPFSSNNQPE